MTTKQPVFLPVAAAYDRWSAFYDAHDNPMVSVAAHVVGALDNVPGQDVIEFGCGTGRNLRLPGMAPTRPRTRRTAQGAQARA